MTVNLRHVSLPVFGGPVDRPLIAPGEYESRARSLYEAARLDWVVVYGDREHFANLAYLTNFDPRFEEALLLLGPGDRRYLIVGNEGVLYSRVLRLEVELVLCQSLSLLGQDRARAGNLETVLREKIGIARGSDVGIVGWKYLGDDEWSFGDEPAFVPAYVSRVLEQAAEGSVRDVTRLMVDPGTGLRSRNSPQQIAQLEWGAARASAAVWNMVRASEPGLTEYELVSRMGYQGEPLSAHLMLASGKGEILGLRSPTARTVERGDGVFTAVGYWGGLTARGGLLEAGPNSDYLDRIVKPYFESIATWYKCMVLGTRGGEVHDAVIGSFDGAEFGPLLNPGHSISLEEWVDTPIRPDSEDELESGMALQCDIIPYPMPDGYTTNCEDTIVLADEALRERLSESCPDLWRRASLRRQFMRDELGLPVSDDVVPLSSTPGYLPPFWLDPELVCAYK